MTGPSAWEDTGTQCHPCRALIQQRFVPRNPPLTSTSSTPVGRDRETRGSNPDCESHLMG
jgi:hypothetical protein